MGKKTGTEGKGDSKSIAERQAQSATARARRAGNGKKGTSSDTGAAPSIEIPTISWMDMVEMYTSRQLATGIHIDFAGEAVFDFETPHTLRLVNTTTKNLGVYLNQDTNVFVTFWQILKKDFVSPLTGKAAKKQMAMITYLREQLGEAGLEKLATAVKTVKLAEAEQEFFEQDRRNRLASTYVNGMNIERWEAAADIKAAKAALEHLTPNNSVQIRVGNSPETGVAFMIWFESKMTSQLVIEVGYVGEQSSLAGQIPHKSLLFCFKGTLGEYFPEADPNKPRMVGAKKFHDFLTGLDYQVKEQLINSMATACRRLHHEVRQHGRNSNVFTLENHHTTQPVDTGVTMNAEERPSPSFTKDVGQCTSAECTVTHEPPKPAQHVSGLQEYVQGLRDAGYDGAMLASMVAAYVGSTEAKQAANN